MSRRFKAAVSAAILTIALAGCGNKESEIKKPVEPSLPEPQTGAAIDAAAEDAMLAAEKAAEEQTEGAGIENSAEAKPGSAKSENPKTGSEKSGAIIPDNTKSR